MTTLTVEIKDNDTEFLLEVIKRINGKVIKTSKKESLLNGIEQGLREAKEIKEGKIAALSLNDI